MAVEWSTLKTGANSPDPNARAGAVIRGQAELEQLMTANGWSRQDGESLYQLLVRVRKQTSAAWLSDDIGWAIKLRNSIAHRGVQPDSHDALRAVQAFADVAHVFGWSPAEEDAPPSQSAAKTRPPSSTEPQTAAPSSASKTKNKKKKTKAKAKTTTMSEPTSKTTTKTKTKTKSKTKSKKSPKTTSPTQSQHDVPDHRGGDWRAMAAALALMVVVVLGISQLSRMSSPSEHTPTLRSWMLPVRATASSVANSCRLEAGGDRVACAATLAVDSDARTAWCEGMEGPGVGEQLTVSLSEQGIIEAVRLKAGYHKDEERFLQNQAPTMVTLTIGEWSEQMSLTPVLDGFSELRLPYPMREETVRLTIDDTTQAQFAVTCISEVELQVQRQ